LQIYISPTNVPSRQDLFRRQLYRLEVEEGEEEEDSGSLPHDDKPAL